MLQTFSHHLGLPLETLEILLSHSLKSLLSLPAVTQLLNSLNTALLKDSLPTAGAILAQHLPPFYDWLQAELNIERVPDSPDHATKWVVGFLGNQDSLEHLVELHRTIPKAALEQSIPRLVGIFEAVEPIAVRQEWQKAIAALCLVLAVAARNPAKPVIPA
jgi:hypothetical protein